jgi:hypothetical protein
MVANDIGEITGSTTQLLIPPRTKMRKHDAPREGPSCINYCHRQWLTISPPCWLPFGPPLTIGDERFETCLPGLFILAGEEPRVQN